MASLLVFDKDPESCSRSVVLAKHDFLRLKVFRFDNKKKEYILI